MCGLAGSLRGSAFDVEEALDRIGHRGPDGRGVARRGEVLLGHVRLAIQDPLPRSDQPFEYRGLTLTYVGELWNADALRGLLEHRGHRFETEGDTEVVAAALEEWGKDALTAFDGMFALAWVDRTGDLYLARDRLGKVPLYWREETPDGLLGREVAWASERRAWKEGGASAEPVPPGTYVKLPNPAEPQPYYELIARGPHPFLAESRPLPRLVQETLRHGVQRRLVADVPVAFLASGGLDSTLILALVKEVRPDVVAYTVVHDAESEDLEAARFACAELDVELREVLVGRPRSLDQVREAVSAIEFSMKAQVEIAWPCLSLAAALRADGFKVVLSGEGADEIFGGYGNLARKATSDDAWAAARHYQVEKMARGNFVRTNKAFMRYGVEARLPFMELPLVERVLGMTVQECPPGKGLLKQAAAGLVPDEIINRKKETFQGGSGVSAAFLETTGGRPEETYNKVAEELFGGIPLG